NNVAVLYKVKGRLSEAEPLYRRALEMYERALPAGHPYMAVRAHAPAESTSSAIAWLPGVFTSPQCSAQRQKCTTELGIVPAGSNAEQFRARQRLVRPAGGGERPQTPPAEREGMRAARPGLLPLQDRRITPIA